MGGQWQRAWQLLAAPWQRFGSFWQRMGEKWQRADRFAEK